MGPGNRANGKQRTDVSDLQIPSDDLILSDISESKLENHEFIASTPHQPEDPDHSSPGLTASNRKNPSKMHQSIITVNTKPTVARCTSCCMYHCPFCPKSMFKPTQPSRLKRHLDVHMKNAITFEDKMICRCNLRCRDGGHFHCPICNKTIIRRDDMEGHLKACQGSAKKASTSAPAQHVRDLGLSTAACQDSSLSSSRHSSAAPSSPLLRSYRAPPSPDLTALPLQDTTFASPSAQPIQTRTFHPSATPCSPLLPSSYVHAAQVTKVKTRISKLHKVKCPLCDVSCLKRNLQKHVLRKHSKTSVDITEEDAPQLVMIKEDSLEWRPILDHKDPEHPQIKEEHEEFWISKAHEQLNGAQDNELTSSPFTPISVKNEVEDKPLSSYLHQSNSEDHRDTEAPSSSLAVQIKSEGDGEDCGGSELARIPDPHSHQQSKPDEQDSDSSETDASDDWQEPLSDSRRETEDSDNGWKETRANKSGVSAVYYKGATENDVTSNSFICFEFVKQFQAKGSLQRHMICHSGKKLFSTLVNEKCGRVQQNVDSEIRVQMGEKLFACDLCGKQFHKRQHLETHMRVHTGEKPYGCDVCERTGNSKSNLKTHMRVHTGEKPYGCDICGKTFNSKSNLKTHMRVHTGERLYGCHLCGKRFSSKSSITTHMRLHTGENPFGCDVCGRRFNNKTKMKTHMGIHGGKKLYGCNVCGKRFYFKVNLKTHMEVHMGEIPFGCDFLDNSTKLPHLEYSSESRERNTSRPTRSDVQKEVPPKLSHRLDEDSEELEEFFISQEQEHTGLQEADVTSFPVTTTKNEDKEKPQISFLHRSETNDEGEPVPPVETNGEGYGGSESSKKRKPDNICRVKQNVDSDVGGEKPFGCDVCGTKFRFRSKLRIHVGIHTREKLFGCDVCGVKFNGKQSLRKHMKVHMDEKPFCCEFCGTRFRFKSKLKIHMRVHTGEKLFGCDVCGKRFREKADLVVHMRIHTGEQPFSCDICGKRFKNKSTLTIHIRVHTGEKPFGCGVCGKRFNNKPNLNTHMRVHTGKKVFVCDVCGKGYYRQSNLREHMRVHTGEKPFICDVCGKNFKTKSTLTVHLRVHTQQKPFDCVVCRKRFKDMSNFRRHMRTHTREQSFDCSVSG